MNQLICDPSSETMDKITYDYYLRSDKAKYNNIFKYNPRGITCDNFRAGALIKLVFVLLAAISFMFGFYVLYLSSVHNPIIITYLFKHLILAVIYGFFTVFTHEQIHRIFSSWYGGQYKIYKRSNGKEVCIETSEHQFSRFEYILGLLAPLLVTSLIGLLHILITFYFTFSIPYMLPFFICAFIFLQCLLSSTDIHDFWKLISKYDKGYSVIMLAQDLNSGNPLNGFVVFKDYNM